MIRKNWLVVVGMAGFLSACHKTGHISEHQYEALHIGQSKSEVAAVLGAPLSQGQNGDGVGMWQYRLDRGNYEEDVTVLFWPDWVSKGKGEVFKIQRQ